MDERSAEETITQAKVIAVAYEEAKQAYEKLSDDRIEIINALREQKVSWSKIGKIFGVSPQAAMYVSGHATRTKAGDGKSQQRKKSGGKT